MRPSLRFLGLVMVGWVGLRSVMLGAIPGGEMFRLKAKPAAAAAPPIIATEFAPIDGPVTGLEAPPPMLAVAPPPPVAVRAARAPPAYYAAYEGPPQPLPMPPPRPRAPFYLASAPEPRFYTPIPTLDQWPLSSIAAATSSPLGIRPPAPGQSAPAVALPARMDRWQLTAWAMLRARQGLVSAPSGLASGSTLGASQGGARIAYNFTPQVAATLRTTNTIGRRGGEVALGGRIQPVRGIPVWVTAERRVALGKYGGGRNAFALFFEGGLWDRPLPLDFRLDAYFQGGVVGLKRRDAFVDGAVTFTRPVYRNFSAGVGVWGGAQPGVYRVDAGPRVTMAVRDNLRVHLDYRQRLAGNAEPGSGPTLTLAGDF
jgi:hypothetical protein